MCAYKDNSDVENIKKREYLKQQHQLRTMTKTTNALSADDMIENLLSKKEIFKIKKDINTPTISHQVNYPSWLSPGQEPFFYKRVWDIVSTPSGFADTPKLTSLLLTSRLPTDALGYIWSLSNVSLGPSLSQIETYTTLALVALVQNGYSFTGVAVLNTLKEAPLPKLDYPLTDIPVVVPGPVFIPTVPTSVAPTTYHSSTIINNVFPECQSTESKSKSVVQSTSTTPNVSNTALSGIANGFSLLDLDLSLPSSSVKSELAKPITSVPISSKISNNGFVEKEDMIKKSQTKLSEKELISEFSPTSRKNGVNLSNSFLNDPKPLFPNDQDLQSPEAPLVDDLFGDFQSVSIPEYKSTVNDEIEFDDFKSADFAPLTLLEVKDKPPEEDLVEHNENNMEKLEPIKLVLHKTEEKSGIEDLFPKCIVKSKEDNFDLLASDEDRYSALRGLNTSNDHEEFGDFLMASPNQPASLPPPLTGYQGNIQERAMEACIEVLEEARKIFESIEEEDVLNEVISDPRGVQYLEELIEVERIALRIRSTLDKEELFTKLEGVSNSLEQYLKPHRLSYMTEEPGPKCGICLCEKGPSYVKYGINNFHAPCANLYLHRVDSILPIAPIM